MEEKGKKGIPLLVFFTHHHHHFFTLTFFSISKSMLLVSRSLPLSRTERPHSWNQRCLKPLLPISSTLCTKFFIFLVIVGKKKRVETEAKFCSVSPRRSEIYFFLGAAFLAAFLAGAFLAAGSVLFWIGGREREREREV